MAHFPKPWFRAARGVWYVQIGGRQINLGGDREAAFAEYHRLMGRHRPGEGPPQDEAAPPVVNVLARFRAWVEANRSAATLRLYDERLQSFIDSLVNQRLTVEQLKPHHVQEWIDAHPAWNDCTKRGRIMAVQTALTWAVRQGIIERSPLTTLRKPALGRRENPVTVADWPKILAAVRRPTLRDLLTVAWETGARPQELRRVEARHVDLAGCRWVFPAKESKGKRLPRVVHLTDTAAAICARLCRTHPSGPLFRNEDDLPWTTFAVNCAMRRLAGRIGRHFALADFRHGFGTRMLAAGNDALTVAALMGHRDPSMLARVYSHVHADASHLRDALSRGKPLPGA
jgi:integrase/recombinase XerC